MQNEVMDDEKQKAGSFKERLISSKQFLENDLQDRIKKINEKMGEIKEKFV